MSQCHPSSTPRSEHLQLLVPSTEEQDAPKASGISVEQCLQSQEYQLKELTRIVQSLAVRLDECEQQIDWLVPKVNELSFLKDRN